MAELKSFTIKKLFNKYDVKIKLDQECVILLGANGVGKSTALRVLYCFLSGNFIDIIAAPFGSIILSDTEDVTEISYGDFLPSKKSMASCFKEGRSYD